MSEPLYQKIYRALKQDIEGGTYKPGDQVPTEEALAKAYRVSKITSKRVLNMLTEDGWLIRQKGRGTFVSDQAPILINESLSAQEPGHINAMTAPRFDTFPSSSALSGRLPRIGLIYPNINGHFGTDSVAAIADACHGRAHLLFSLSRSGSRYEEETILQMISAPVDGLIVFPGPSQFLNPHLLQMVINRYPLVLIDQNIQAISQTSVCTDNTDAVFQALSYIAKHGHRYVCIMRPTISNNVLQERLDAVFQCSATTGLPLYQNLWLNDVNLPADSIQEADIDRIARHLFEHPEITAILAFHYAIAVAAQQAAEKIGRQIGRDLAILSFDSPRPLFGRPLFTHIRQNETAIGQKAVELLLALIQNRDLPPQTVRIPAKLIEGESFFTLKRS